MEPHLVPAAGTHSPLIQFSSLCLRDRPRSQSKKRVDCQNVPLITANPEQALVSVKKSYKWEASNGFKCQSLPGSVCQTKPETSCEPIQSFLSPVCPKEDPSLTSPCLQSFVTFYYKLIDHKYPVVNTFHVITEKDTDVKTTHVMKRKSFAFTFFMFAQIPVFCLL